MVMLKSGNEDADHDTSNPRSQHGVAAVVEVRARSTSPSRSKHQSRPDTGFQQGIDASPRLSGQDTTMRT